jgi:exodeoxyribonuclease V alpha subunit
MPEPYLALHAAGVVGDLDVAFADLVRRLDGRGGSAELALAAALVSRRVADGHVCLPLDEYAGQPLSDAAPRLRAPSRDAWAAALRRSPVVGSPGARTPLVLDDADRVYLWRYWSYEQRLAAALRARAAHEPRVDRARLRADLRAVFASPPDADADVDWQRVAAATAALRGLCVVSGGPGTGKTSTVAQILALLVLQASARGEQLRVALAAPTGKAAARMDESLRGSAARERLPPAARALWPEGASTLHRLLGARPDSVYFRHDAAHPLPLDVLVVDEASMVDLALMAKVVDALPADARLIVLGDRDQLASVEAGAVLGDVCGPAPGCSAAFAATLAECGVRAAPATSAVAAPLADVVVPLRRSWRFGAASGIGRLAAAVKEGDADAAVALLREGSHADVAWADPPAGELPERLAEVAAAGFGPYAAAVARGDVAAAFAAFARFRVLCAHRTGPSGVGAVGRRVEDALAARGLLAPTAGWYAGRSVMVLRNDYGQRLFNGDVGLALPDGDGEPRVWFEAPGGGVRAVAPPRLPAHETVWAMTVHKSQGSEFDEVLVVLPPEPSRVVTRELLYTAVTRARRRVTIWGSPAVVAAAVATPVQRSSGLRDALWSTG